MKAWTPEEIKEFRKRLGLYQKDLAALLGVTQRYVAYLEGGLKEPSETLKRLMDCLESKQKERKVKK